MKDFTSPPDQSENLPELDPLKKAGPRWIWIGCILLVIVAAMHSADCKIGGGDTWVAMALGRYTVNDWAQNQPEGRTWQMRFLDKFGIHMTQRDPISAKTRKFDPISRSADSMWTRLKVGLTGGDKSEYDPRYEHVGWVNQNWLTHVLFYKMKTALGGNEFEPQPGEFLIVLYKMIQAVFTALLTYWAARALGAHPILASGCAAFGILLSRSFVDLRPNVTTILFGAAMIVVLVYWKRGRHRAMLWMIPIMILWSNVHGGFIYAIMVFWLAVGAYVVHKLVATIWPNSFVDPSGRAMAWLIGGAIGVTIIPGIFSPFGWENLIHPLVVASGDEGKVWRDVVEWRPISDPRGFGNATPYLFFLGLFALTFVTWWMLFMFKPHPPEARKRRSRKPLPEIPWPKIDLAHLAIIAITLAMSIKSRRFIFLGGVLLSAFLAQMIQDIVNMIRVLHADRPPGRLELPPMPREWSRCLGIMALVAFLVVAGVFGGAMYDMYFKTPLDADDLNVFRRMVGLPAQAPGALRFLRDNQIKGVVFNEWVHGGFISYHQPPDPETGSPPCKVHMDGRSQAAYELRHFQWWQRLRSFVGTSHQYYKEYFTQLKDYAKQQRLALSDPELYDDLFERFRREQDNKRKNFFGAMASVSLNDPQLYDALLTRDGATAVLLDASKSNVIYVTLMRSRKWKLVYFDHKFCLLLSRDAPANREFFSRFSAWELVYADENTKSLLMGYELCGFRDPQTRRRGLDVLMKVKFTRHVPLAYNAILRTATDLKEYDLLWNYLVAQHDQLKTLIDSGQRFGALDNTTRIIRTTEMMRKIAPRVGKEQELKTYQDQKAHFIDVRSEWAKQFGNRLLW